MTVRLRPRTVVEAFLPFTGEVPLAEVYDTANLAGIDDQRVRLAIRRIIAAGDVVQHGRGRGGTLSLTGAGRRRLQRDRHGLALAFAQDAGDAKWNECWNLIAFSAPESDRKIRDGMRRELVGLGAVAVSTGLYVSPHNLGKTLLADTGADNARYLTTATTSNLSLQGVNDPMLIAETLWPQAPVIAAYQSLEEAIRQDADDVTLPRSVCMLHLAEALERAMRNDPLIPLELRPHPWPPSSIREGWARRWEALQHGSGATIYSGWWPQPHTSSL